jgi:molecular chaperone GrpE (heat shock protein)
VNQHTETTETNEKTYAESQQFGQSAPESSSGRGLTTADIANGRQQSSDSQPSDSQPSDSQQAAEQAEHLIPEEHLGSLREKWSTIQTSFVDEPKDSVQKADELVAEVIQTLAQRFAEERDSLERQWSGGGDPSTEDLRKALQHYRSFFERLLAA